ncbi:hypothetical protein CC86DRAFT_382259 [Ophiobolus disseminans]|uniref:Uncharacterized protein n=1 Tax=Ophiobolus disseminans TaxID=1469910 RepID=A0A6A6ZZB0_9PLEO|nr:hypothetical protein CC86DRAFT_382259 [Ophiobolus disseminans]
MPLNGRSTVLRMGEYEMELVPKTDFHTHLASLALTTTNTTTTTTTKSQTSGSTYTLFCLVCPRWHDTQLTREQDASMLDEHSPMMQILISHTSNKRSRHNMKLTSIGILEAQRLSRQILQGRLETLVSAFLRTSPKSCSGSSLVNYSVVATEQIRATTTLYVAIPTQPDTKWTRFDDLRKWEVVDRINDIVTPEAYLLFLEKIRNEDLDLPGASATSVVGAAGDMEGGVSKEDGRVAGEGPPATLQALVTDLAKRMRNLSVPPDQAVEERRPAHLRPDPNSLQQQRPSSPRGTIPYIPSYVSNYIQHSAKHGLITSNANTGQGGTWLHGGSLSPGGKHPWEAFTSPIYSL